MQSSWKWSIASRTLGRRNGNRTHPWRSRSDLIGIRHIKDWRRSCSLRIPTYYPVELILRRPRPGVNPPMRVIWSLTRKILLVSLRCKSSECPVHKELSIKCSSFSMPCITSIAECNFGGRDFLVVVSREPTSSTGRYGTWYATGKPGIRATSILN